MYHRVIVFSSLPYRRDDTTRSLETHWRYLTSLRPKIAGALASHQITPSQSHLFSDARLPRRLLSIPYIHRHRTHKSVRDELVKSAQIVGTTSFKSHLVGRPSILVGRRRMPRPPALLQQYVLRLLCSNYGMIFTPFHVSNRLGKKITRGTNSVLPSPICKSWAARKHLDQIFLSLHVGYLSRIGRWPSSSVITVTSLYSDRGIYSTCTIYFV